jgi:lipopolysaccharide/colanic/teichoic acid biosynthesis glycosyltransferase
MDNVFAMSGQGAAYAADGGCAGDGRLTVVSGGSEGTGADDVPLLPLREKNTFSRKVDRRGGARGSVLSYRAAGSSTYSSVHAEDDVVTADFEMLGADETAASTTNFGETAVSTSQFQVGDSVASGSATVLPYRVMKRAFDILFSSAVIVIGAIPIALICVAIRIESKGSPFYSQERMGKHGKVIRVLKLRSMYSDADNVRKYLSEEQVLQWQTERKVDDDPRITRIGKFIRSTSIDEIPQFMNVLVGNLSVIGPRPITRDELDQHFSQEQRERLLSVRPGITGLWQVGERNGATFESGRRQKIELSYVDRAGLRMDGHIFWATFGAMFGHGRNGR